MRISRGLISATLALLIAGRGQTQTPASVPQPLGKLVDVGGYRVHLYCIGNGSPTAVITGAGFSFDWGLVQPELAKFTRVCAYDHSGIAWSDPGPKDKCSLRVGELHSALMNAGIKGPFILVGHSLGALVSRLYASTYASEVAGLVFVDHAASPEDMKRFVLQAPKRLTSSPPSLVMKPDPNAGFEKLSERDYRLHIWATSKPGSSTVLNRNAEMMSECSADLEAATRNQATPLGDKPLIVLSSPITEQVHASLLSLSSNSKQMVAADSGHYVMVDRPDLVIEAVREVVAAARHHSKLTTR